VIVLYVCVLRACVCLCVSVRVRVCVYVFVFVYFCEYVTVCVLNILLVSYGVYFLVSY